MTVQVASKTDRGRTRENNEDNVYSNPELGIFIICDGMGGHLAGEVASEKAIEFAVEFLQEEATSRNMPIVGESNFRDEWIGLVVDAVSFASEKLINFAALSPEFDGMATTMTLLLILEDVAFVGHIGDSRLYLKNGSQAKQLTCDHTLLEEMMQEIPNWVEANGGIESVQHYGHVLTRCVGLRTNIEVDSFHFQLAKHDVLLLCSDGLSCYFDDTDSIVNFLDIEDACGCVESLVAFANNSGGKDNISAIVIRVLDLIESKIDSASVSCFAGQPHYDLDTSEWPTPEMPLTGIAAD